MLKKAMTIPQNDYSGGMNSAENPLKVKLNESPDCANVHSNAFGSIEKRKGKTALNTTAASGGDIGYASMDFEITATSRKLVAIFDETLHKMDDIDGTWDPITMTVAMGVGRAELRQYTKMLVMASHISGNVQRWDGSAGATATISGSAAFKYIWPDDTTGRLWACGLASNEGIAFFTPVNTLSFDTTNDKIQVTNTGTLLGFRSLKGRLYAFSAEGWFRIDDLGGNPRFGARWVCGPGTLSPESVQLVNLSSVGEVLMYLDTNRQLRVFSGTDTARVSFKFDHRAYTSQAHSLDRVNTSRLDDVFATVYPARNWYMLHYSEDSGNTNNNCMIYDVNALSGWPFTKVAASTATMARDANDTQRLYQTGYTGITWQADSGTEDDGSTIPSHYDLARQPSAEDAQRRGLLHKWREIMLTLKATGGYTLDVGVRMDFETSFRKIHDASLSGVGAVLGAFILGTDTLGGQEAVLVPVGIDRLGKMCQIRLSDNSGNPAWQLFGDETSARPLGVY